MCILSRCWNKISDLLEGGGKSNKTMYQLFLEITYYWEKEISIIVHSYKTKKLLGISQFVV